MKVKWQNFCIYICLCILMFLPVFQGFLSIYTPKWRVYLLIIAVFLMIIANIEHGIIKFPSRLPFFYFWWFAFCVLVFGGFSENSYVVVKIFSGLLISIWLMRKTDWTKYIFQIVFCFTGICVFFTFFYFFVPEAYTVMIKIYGYIPSGTSSGAAGYRAGITNHYSSNGIFCALFFMLAFIRFISLGNKYVKDIRHKNTMIMISAIGMIALLLTGKRGVLVWSILAVIITYFIYNNKNIKKYMSFLIATIFISILFIILSNFIPEIGYVFSRFKRMGKDSGSMERLSMWDLALKTFTKKPILGIGFLNFRNLYMNNLSYIYHKNVLRYQKLDAHNVYIQVLCETGIVGFVFYILAIGLVLLWTMRLLKKNKNIYDANKRFVILFSLCIQIFYIIYSMTGNCLYDIVFYLYIIALSITASFWYDSRLLSKNND